MEEFEFKQNGNRKEKREQSVKQENTRRTRNIVVVILTLLVAFVTVVSFILVSKPKTNTTSSNVVMTINQQKFSLADFNFQRYLSRQSLFEKTDFVTETELAVKLESGEKVAQVFESDIIDGLKMEVAVLQLAEKYQIKLSATDKAAIKQQKADFIASFADKKAYKAFLVTEDMTDKAIEKYLNALKLKALLSEKVFNEGGQEDLTNDEKATAKQEYLEKYAKIKYVYLALVDEAGNPLTEEQIVEKQAIAETIVSNEADLGFDDYIAEYSEDQSELGKNGDYVFKDEDNQLSQAVFALSEEQISGVQNFDDSLMVIQRIALDEAKLSEYQTILLNEKQSQALNDLIKGFKVKEGQAFAKIEIK